MTADSAATYFRTKVLTAPPEQLRLMLLEGAVKFARQGRDGLVGKNYDQIFTGFSKSRDIVIELMTSIRPDTEPTLRSRVQGLYTFIYKLLVDASFEKDPAKADKAIELLEYERETWELALRKAAEERKVASPTSAQATGPAAESGRPALSIQA